MTSSVGFASLISIHAPRGGSDEEAPFFAPKYNDFNPRSPWGERLTDAPACKGWSAISIHAPRGGSDCIEFISRFCRIHFNPRSPWGERRGSSARQAFSYYISIHAPRGGSDVLLLLCFLVRLAFQSTLPVGGATRNISATHVDIPNFNPRSPWGERHRPAPLWGGAVIFQSTLPVGGATQTGGGDSYAVGISIHAPRGGSDR